MAKLSRMQKYADLRNGISETKVNTIESDVNVTHYEDKLKKLESFFNGETKTNIKNDTDYLPPNADKSNTKINNSEDNEFDNKESIENILNSIDGSFDNTKAQVEEMPEIINKKNINVKQERKDDIEGQNRVRHESNGNIQNINNFNNFRDKKHEGASKLVQTEEDVVEFLKEFESSIEKEEFRKTKVNENEDVIAKESKEKTAFENLLEEKKVEEVKDNANYDSFVRANIKNVKINEIDKETDGLSNIIDKFDEQYEKPSVINYAQKIDAKEEIKEESKESINMPTDDKTVNSQTNGATVITNKINNFTNEVASSLEPVIEEINNINVENNKGSENEKVESNDSNFVTSALKEVEDFNKVKGNTTLSDLPSALVDEVRHIDNEVKNRSIDDEFNDTVSIEISKVLNEIKTQKSDDAKIDNDIVNNSNKAEFEAQKAFDSADARYDTFNGTNTNNLASGEPVVEIKNISETMNHSLINDDILNDTIPFVVNNEINEAEPEDDDEKASPVLNVILIILIIVLLGVFAVFIYYILVARGIIE